MSATALRASLRLWLPRLAYRRRHLAQARRDAASGSGDAKPGVITAAEAARIRKWRSNVAEAERNVNRRRAQLARLRPKPSSRGAAVAWMTARLGTTERPAGSNRGPTIDVWQRRFGFRGAPWCGIVVGNAMVAAGVKGVTSRIASVALIEDDARARRAPFRGWSSGAGVMRGDLVVIGGRGTHVEMVVQRRSDGSCVTRGGNTSSGPGGSQSNGGGLFARVRSSREITGYALVRY